MLAENALALKALSYLRGPLMENVELNNKMFSAIPRFLVIPGILEPLPLKRISSKEIGEEEFQIWNLCFLDYDRAVYIGQQQCIELTHSFLDPLHKELDAVLALLIEKRVDENF